MADNPSDQDRNYYLNVDSYYDQLHRTTWARRTAGLLAGATTGGLYGAMVGAVAAFIPYVFSAVGIAAAGAALPTLAVVGSSVALFAAITAVIGMTITADVAAAAASSAAGLEEKERREKLAQVKSGELAQETEIAEPENTNGRTKAPPMFSWKVAAISVPLFAAFGALVAVNPYTAAAVFDKAAFPGFVGTNASIAASATVFGMFGAFLGAKTSLLTNSLTNFYYDIITEQAFNDKQPQQEKALSTAPQQEMEKSEEQKLVPEARRKSFTEGKVCFSLQELMQRSKDPKASQDVTVSR